MAKSKTKGGEQIMNNLTVTNSDVREIRSRATAGQYVEALNKLSEIKGDMLSPHDVVDEARNPKSPLHTAFTWEDTQAATQYRLLEARMLLTKVRVEYMGKKQQAFFNTRVVIDNVVTQGYFPIERAMNDEDIHNSILRDAVRSLKYAQQKYKDLSEINEVIDAKKLKKLEKKVAK